MGHLKPKPLNWNLVFLQGHFDSSITKLQSLFLRLRRWTRCEKKTSMHCIELDYAFQKPGDPWDSTIKTSQPTCFFCTLHHGPMTQWSLGEFVQGFKLKCRGLQPVFFFAKTLPTEDFFGWHRKIWSKGQKNRTFFLFGSVLKKWLLPSWLKIHVPLFFFVCVCVQHWCPKKKNLEGGSGAPAICW